MLRVTVKSKNGTKWSRAMIIIVITFQLLELRFNSQRCKVRSASQMHTVPRALLIGPRPSLFEPSPLFCSHLHTCKVSWLHLVWLFITTFPFCSFTTGIQNKSLSVVCVSVLGFCVGSLRWVLSGASGTCSPAAALQERVGAVERLVRLLT